MNIDHVLAAIGILITALCAFERVPLALARLVRACIPLVDATRDLLHHASGNQQLTPSRPCPGEHGLVGDSQQDDVEAPDSVLEVSPEAEAAAPRNIQDGDLSEIR